MPRRRPADCAGFPAMLGPGGTRRTRSLRSLRHAARLFPPGAALLGAIEADGLAAERWVQVATASEPSVPGPRHELETDGAIDPKRFRGTQDSGMLSDVRSASRWLPRILIVLASFNICRCRSLSPEAG